MRRVALLALLAGCAYNSAFKGADAVAEALCQRAFVCQASWPEGAELAFIDVYTTNVPQCVADLGPADPDAWEAAEEQGRLTYDRDLARACVDAIALRSCEQHFTEPLPEPCDRAIQGTLVEGAACALDAVCQSGWCRDGACTAP
jgi:hypothetical protein